MKSVEDIVNDSLEQIETMVENGATDKEVAIKLGIGYSTYKKYKATNDELKAILVQAKDKKNQAVEQAVYKNAVGYVYFEEVVTKVKREELAKDGATVLSQEDVVINKIQKYSKGDLAAQKYWLNNKQKMHWKEDPNKVDNDKKLTKLKEKEINSKIIDM